VLPINPFDKIDLSYGSQGVETASLDDNTSQEWRETWTAIANAL
jgi:hypothetical protein